VECALDIINGSLQRVFVEWTTVSVARHAHHECVLLIEQQISALKACDCESGIDDGREHVVGR
jgi:hypothetical protein